MTNDDIFAVTYEEGGQWHPPGRVPPAFPQSSPWTWRVHSILFRDGTTWDEINGFRDKLFDYTPKSMAIVRSHWGSV